MPVQDLEWQRYHISLPDGGAQYAETNLSNFIVEPWNALSSLLFLIPAFYWAIKIRNHIKEYAFIAYCVPLLILGGLGSTLFHAFRSSPLLLWMDILPILLLTLSVSFHFLNKITKSWWVAIGIVLCSFIIRKLLFGSTYFSRHTASNISYAVAGITIFLPALIIVYKTDFQKIKTLVISILMFILALLCREIDAREFHMLSMGTHFLWHVFCAAGSYYLAAYLYYLRDMEVYKVPIKLPETFAMEEVRNSKH